jgi:hypothetical protein
MKWISIKDRLPNPEKDISILVLGKCGCWHPATSWNDKKNYLEYTINKGKHFVGDKIDFDYWMIIPDQPERSKRKDLDCCKRIEDLRLLFYDLIIENRNHQSLVLIEDLLQEAKMRCSEHCGNTVRDK